MTNRGFAASHVEPAIEVRHFVIDAVARAVPHGDPFAARVDSHGGFDIVRSRFLLRNRPIDRSHPSA